MANKRSYKGFWTNYDIEKVYQHILKHGYQVGDDTLENCGINGRKIIIGRLSKFVLDVNSFLAKGQKTIQE